MYDDAGQWWGLPLIGKTAMIYRPLHKESPQRLVEIMWTVSLHHSILADPKSKAIGRYIRSNDIEEVKYRNVHALRYEKWNLICQMFSAWTIISQ